MTFPTLTREGKANASRIPADAQPPQTCSTELAARPYLLKCTGTNLISCATCSRRIAPAAAIDQRWVEPPEDGPCSYYANVEEIGWVYQIEATQDAEASSDRAGD